MYLVDGIPQPKTINFEINDIPKSGFQVPIYRHVRSPHWRAYVVDPTGFECSRTTQLLSLPKQEPGFKDAICSSYE